MKSVVHKYPNCKANLDLKEESTSGVGDYCRLLWEMKEINILLLLIVVLVFLLVLLVLNLLRQTKKGIC